MKKLLFTISMLPFLCGCTDYSKCPNAPYGVHDFRVVEPHSDYVSFTCKYCDLYIESYWNTDYLRVQNPKTEEFMQYKKSDFDPKYINTHELKGKK